MEKLKVIIGAGGTKRDGWVSLDESDLDITSAAAWSRLFVPASIDAIVCEHVFEHLSYAEGTQAARLCLRYLKPLGVLRVAVPDGLHSSADYVEWVDVGNWWNEWTNEPHKVLYNYLSLSRVLKSAGFAVRLREWHDARRVFHQCDGWTLEDGYIARRHGSAWSQMLSIVVGGTYTSLIADGIKPLESERTMPARRYLLPSQHTRSDENLLTF
jgi:predicted SAM-dependent methyltransferase